MNRCFLLTILFISSGIFSSCETVKGAGTGFKKDVESYKVAACELGQHIKSTDEWIQKNMW